MNENNLDKEQIEIDPYNFQEDKLEADDAYQKTIEDYPGQTTPGNYGRHFNKNRIVVGTLFFLFAIGLFGGTIYFLNPLKIFSGDKKTESSTAPAAEPSVGAKETSLPVEPTPSPQAQATPETPAATEEPTSPASPLVKVINKQMGTFNVPSGTATIMGVLTWPSEPVYSLKIILIDPAGKEATAINYPGSTFNQTRPAQTFIKNPLPGKWTAYAYGENIPDQSSQYYFIASSL